MTPAYIVSAVILLGGVLYWLQSRQSQKPGGHRQRFQNTPATEADILTFIEAGRKIDAIKAYREVHRVGLKEAKEAVEAMERKR
ncbi:MAG: ribosomal protein L7/L12 [Bdellovibrionales bacterium]|nr:ribosomal protein L7/L12 [Bdellovibrionales bacterium]